MKKVLYLITLISIIFSLNALIIEAAEPVVTGGGTPPVVTGGGTPPPAQSKFLGNPIKVNNVKDAIILAVDLAIFVGTIFAVLMFIWVGFQFVMAQGSDTKLSEAKKWFLNAVIGTAILISAKVIVEVIKSTLVSSGVVEQKLFEEPK